MPRTLLLADDSVTIQKVVGISFANEDVVLLTVDNGDDAIARAREARPDVILADVVMPGKNGYEVCQAIKSDPALAHIPVLLLTGTFEAFDEQRAARAGADGHITKPFEAQALVDKVNALLARGSAAPAAAAEPARLDAGAGRPARAATPAPPAPPAPHAPHVSHTADTAYDFFDEEDVTAPRSGSASRDEATTLVVPPVAAPDPVDEGFSFDDPVPAAPAAPRPPAHRPASPVHAARAPAGERGATPADGDALAFDDVFERGAREESSLFADALDDLDGAPTGPAHAPTRILGEASGGTGIDAASPGATRFGAPAPAAGPAPLDALDELELEAAGGTGDFGEEPFEPAGARDYDVSSSDLGAPLAQAPPLPAQPPRAPAPAAPWSAHEEPSAPWPAEPEPVAPARASSAVPAAREAAPAPSREPAAPAATPLAAAAAAPALGREELRDMLEKMAWEAFGPLTERLVRDAVERIERVAWEVVPQIAEAVIREEIRKLKGE